MSRQIKRYAEIYPANKARRAACRSKGGRVLQLGSMREQGIFKCAKRVSRRRKSEYIPGYKYRDELLQEAKALGIKYRHKKKNAVLRSLISSTRAVQNLRRIPRKRRINPNRPVDLP